MSTVARGNRARHGKYAGDDNDEDNSVEDYHSDDDFSAMDDGYDDDDEPRPAKRKTAKIVSKAKSAARKPKAGKAKPKIGGGTPAYPTALMQLLTSATREELEGLICAELTSGRVFTLEEMQQVLDPHGLQLKPAPAYVESEARMGLTDGLSKELLLQVASYLPTREMFKIAERVCKTWCVWLRHEPVIYSDLQISLCSHSQDSSWVNANGLVKMIQASPDTSIQTLELTADDKSSKLHKTKHIGVIFKTYMSKFSSLRVLKLFGAKLCKDALPLIAAFPLRELESMSVTDAATNVVEVCGVIAHCPRLKKLSLPGMNKEHLAAVREALKAACPKGEQPLLESLEAQPKYGWDQSFSVGSSGSIVDLLSFAAACPNLRCLRLPLQLPHTQPELELMLQTTPPTGFPNIDELLFSVTSRSAGFHFWALGLGYVSATHSPVVHAFLVRLETLFPNLTTLKMYIARRYLSKSDIKRGETREPPVELSGTHTFLHMKNLVLKNVNVSGDFNIEAPELESLTITNTNAGTSFTESVKATCPKLSKVLVDKSIW